MTELDDKGRKKEIFFKLYVQEVKSYMFFEISEITKDDLPYEIVVNSRSLVARIPALNLIATKGSDCKFFN